jgi:hypothetical protein
MLAGTHALATLDADLRLGTGALGDDLDTAQILVELLVESLGAGADTSQTSHTLNVLLDRQFFHMVMTSLLFICFLYYTIEHQKKQHPDAYFPDLVFYSLCDR